MSEGSSEGEKEGAAEEAFPDVDLKALEKEILGGGAPEVERIETEEVVPAAELSEDEEIQLRAKSDLEKADKNLKERIAKYSDMVADVKVSPKSTVTRVEARRRQRGLEADWDPQNLSELDELRRQFTKALFKK